MNIEQNSDYFQNCFFQKKIFDVRSSNENFAFESSFPNYLYQNEYSNFGKFADNSGLVPFSMFGSNLTYSNPYDFHMNNMPYEFQTQNQNQNLISQNRCLNNQMVKPTNDVADQSEPETVTGINYKRRTVEVKREGDKEEVVIKGQWTYEEDKELIRLVKENGKRNWTKIASKLRGRVGKQCRERWQNHLQPNIKKDEWSAEEDKVLIAAHKVIGNKWAEMAKILPGRSENTIKNHWNATKRKQLAALRRGDTNQRITALQSYINSLIISTPPPAAGIINQVIIQSPNTASPPSYDHENNSAYEYSSFEKEEMFPAVSTVTTTTEEDSFISMFCANGSGFEFGSLSSSSCCVDGGMISGSKTPSIAEEELAVEEKEEEMEFVFWK